MSSLDGQLILFSVQASYCRKDFILLMKKLHNTDRNSTQPAHICQPEHYKNISHGKQRLLSLTPKLPESTTRKNPSERKEKVFPAVTAL